MRRLRLKIINDRILASVYSDPRAAVLHEFLRHDARIYVLAGAIRDALAREYAGTSDGTPRDFDIAISNVSRELFDSIVTTYGVRNRHDGYLLTSHLLPRWDVWRLEDSVGLRKTNTVCTIENVLRTFNLSCNAIALDVRTGVFTDAGAIDSVGDQRVAFVPNAIVHSERTFAAKALLSQLRFSYAIDSELQHFVRKHLDRSALLHESLKIFPGLAVLADQDAPPQPHEHRSRPCLPI
jgi:hypothetical protein